MLVSGRKCRRQMLSGKIEEGEMDDTHGSIAEKEK